MPRNQSRSAKTRGAESRASSERSVPKTVHTSRFYIPTSVIPAGMTYAWVAVAHDSTGTPNADNWRNKFRNGWRPVPRDRHPDLFPPVPNIGFGDDTDDVIKEGGQILCEKPTADVQKDQADNAARAKQQMDGINWTQAPGQNPFLPRFDNSTQEFKHGAEFKE